MLSARVLSVIVALPIFLLFIYLGDVYLLLFLLALMFVGNLEFKRILETKDLKINLMPIVLGNFLFLLAIQLKLEAGLSLGLGVSFLLILFFFIKNFPNSSLEDVSANVFMLIYVGWSLSYVFAIRSLEQGLLLIALLFLIIWSTDTGAYFIGRAFGKNKLAPKLSPKKTIEGAVGGLLVSVLVGVTFSLSFGLFQFFDALLISLIVSTSGQIGDLIESAFKRLAEIKDSGNILPGHGGILDRFDSTILAAPIFFFLISLL